MGGFSKKVSQFGIGLVCTCIVNGKGLRLFQASRRRLGRRGCEEATVCYTISVTEWGALGTPCGRVIRLLDREGGFYGRETRRLCRSG